MPDEEYVTVAEASRVSGLSKRHLTRLLHNGTIDGTKPARDWMVRLSAVMTYLKEERKPGPKSRKDRR